MSMKHFIVLATISLLGYVFNINTGFFFICYLLWLDANYNLTKVEKTKRSEIRF